MDVGCRRGTGTISPSQALYVYVCPYCGKQYTGPSGHRMAGDDRATSCFHRHPGERGVSQPLLVRIAVQPVNPLALAPVPHDRPAVALGEERP